MRKLNFQINYNSRIGICTGVNSLPKELNIYTTK